MPQHQTMSRQEKGQQLARQPNAITSVGNGRIYRVRSGTGNRYYQVAKLARGWTCTCPDYLNRSVKCKHAWAIEYLTKNRAQNA